MSERKKVKDLKVGDSVDMTLLVQEKELKEFVSKAGYYLQAKFGDSSGSIGAKCWDRAEETGAIFEPGEVVHIIGVVESFKGRLQLIFTLEGVKKSADGVSEYLPRTSKEIDLIFGDIVKTAESMKNEYLKAVVFSFLNDSKFIAGFKETPAAKIHHHNYIGGLLEHTQSVMVLCKTIIKLYPELDRDLLLTGAILHDIGKTAAYVFDFRIDVTDEGGLVNHIVLGYQMVEERIRAIEGFPKELELRLLHLLVSHHNYGEWGSPVKPLFAEAEALFLADMLDARLNEYSQQQMLEAVKEREGVWSGFNRRLDRFIYLGDAYPKGKERKKYGDRER
ncbi:MAG: HD domain-containing protein [Euryarchaeota archaeon]|nr:HD domain-containing protein [Euryarchaeota archaeon]